MAHDADDLEDCLARFEQAWQERPPARLEDFMPADAARAAVRRQFLHDAIPIDLEYRWCRSNEAADDGRPTLDDYCRRYPELGQASALPVFLIGEEYRVRRWAGESPAHADYAQRFPTQSRELINTLTAIDAELSSHTLSATRLPTVEMPRPPAQGADLLADLRKHGLLDDAQVRALTAAGGVDVAALARQLVERGWLSPFQADMAARGRTAQLVIGPYLLIDRIGAGWSSNVFRARHTGLARIVALKVFRRELVQGIEPDTAKRFYQEMQAVGRLSHPNVVHAYDAGPAGESLFLAMEYLDGVDLQKLVQQGGPLAPAQAADFIYQAALGLQHAAEHRLVHRDVKPSNLLLAAQARSSAHPWGQVKLLDLGLARIHQAVRTGSASALTRTGCLMGTADFMAPEQGFDPRTVDIRADLYSLGCTLYFLLAGKPPFAGGTFLQKMNRHRLEEPAPLPRGDVPAPLTAILWRLLAKNPDERFTTPAELCAALNEQRPRPATARPRRRAVLALLVALALLIPGSFALWPGKERTPSAVPAPKKEETQRPFAVALEFDGVADVVLLPEKLLAGAPELTLEARFKTKAAGVLFGYQDVPYSEAPRQHVSALYVGSDGKLHGDLWNQTHFRLASSGRVDDGRWHHAALVAGKGEIALYLDGRRVDGQLGAVDHLQMIHNQVGAGFTSDHPAGNNGWYHFQGKLGELRVWHTARNDEELRRFLEQKLKGNEAGLAAYYPIDDGTARQLLDRTPAVRSGTLQGARRVSGD